MPSLPANVLFNRLSTALSLSGGKVISSSPATHPAKIELSGGCEWIVYLWTITEDRSTEGRPLGEYKIQLEFASVERTSHAVAGKANRYTLNFSNGGSRTALLGYSPDFGVFAGWQASLYGEFGRSPNRQVHVSLLEEARDQGWAVASPRKIGATKNIDEVRVAFIPSHLGQFLELSEAADKSALSGKARELFLLQNAPIMPGAKSPLPLVSGLATDQEVDRERQRVAASRLYRDSKFSEIVRTAYNYSCAICDVQLNIIEAAHIVPVSDSRSKDERWNGIALCGNHHKLFDSLAFTLRTDLTVDVNEQLVRYLEQIDRGGGILNLKNLKGKKAKQPSFWGNASERCEMQKCLQIREKIAGF